MELAVGATKLLTYILVSSSGFSFMPSRDRSVRAGGGGGPSRGGGEGVRDGAGGSASRAIGVTGGRPRGRLRYSPGEEREVRMGMEKRLRLQRLEQVRQQSRQQAAAVREEYRQRREENKRAALRESKVRRKFKLGCCFQPLCPWQHTRSEGGRVRWLLSVWRWCSVCRPNFSVVCVLASFTWILTRILGV